MNSGFRGFIRDHLPAFSPVNEAVLFSSRRTGNDDVYLLDLTTDQLSNLTDHPSADVMAKWSPDGPQIVFVSDRSGSFQLYLMSVAGDYLVRLEQ